VITQAQAEYEAKYARRKTLDVAPAAAEAPAVTPAATEVPAAPAA